MAARKIWRSKCGLAELRCGDWREVLADVEQCDAVITDPPYSERTHAGHDASANGHIGFGKDSAKRQTINYTFWNKKDVSDFVESIEKKCLGWFVSMTSHDLCEAWQDSFLKTGRYSFAPLPFVSPGSRCRLSGDGPSSWTCWIMVARPRSLSRWGTLPGAYVYPSSGLLVSGGKPAPLMRAIIRDYTKPGDLVVDPFAGGATTLLACMIEGRRCIGAEIDPETYTKAVRRLSAGYTPGLFNEVQT